MPNEEKTVMVHLSEIGEWTPELAEEIAGIEVWPDPKPMFWSIPRERAHEFPFLRDLEEKRNA